MGPRCQVGSRVGESVDPCHYLRLVSTNNSCPKSNIRFFSNAVFSPHPSARVLVSSSHPRPHALLANSVRRNHRVDLLQPSTTTAVHAGQHHGHVWRNAQVVTFGERGRADGFLHNRGGARQRCCDGFWPSPFAVLFGEEEGVYLVAL